jgi:hypothetical protein
VSYETRNGKGHYYTRSRRQGGRIVREYLGAGDYGEYFAALDARARAEAAERAADSWMEVDGLDELDKLVAAYVKTVEVAAREALVAAGYRQHQRGEWRKTRGQA